MSQPRGHQSTRILVSRLLGGYVRRYRLHIGFAFAMMVIAAAATALLAKQIEPAIDDIFLERRADLLWPTAIAVVIIFFVRGAATFGQSFLMSSVGLRIVAQIQNQLFEKLIRADMAFFHSESPGKLISRSVNDANLLQRVVSTTVTSIGKEALTAAGLVGVAFYQDWMLASIALLVFPAAVLLIVRTGGRLRGVSRNTQASMSNLVTHLDEAFQNIHQVKAYGREKAEIERIKEAIATVTGLRIKTSRTSASLSPVMETLGGFAFALVILYGGNEVIQGNKAPGSFFSFIAAFFLAYEPAKKLSKLNSTLQMGLAAAERVFAILDSEPRITDPIAGKPLEITRGLVEIKNVTFAYQNGGDEGKQVPPALQDITLTAKPHQTVALVGASGAGKSSIFNLILRFYDVQAGQILIDGQDIRGTTLSSLRGSLALVSQETLLFDDTIFANIAYGKENASERDVVHAAKCAQAHDFITSLPAGYQTIVGPRGCKLSGGQRQRIAIARVMMRDAPILLLDEATSALDTESEMHVQTALTQLMKGRTTFVIAHRLSTVVAADIIYIFDKGRIVEQGDHQTLLSRGGVYSKLFAMQFDAATTRCCPKETQVFLRDTPSRPVATS